jgi:heptosyltransferase-3
MIALPPHARILVVALRRLGDVLLTTPLIRSLKQAFPDAAIEALVFAGTEGILAGNPDLAGVITMSPRTPTGSVALARALWRQYDLAISTQSGDRPILFAWIAGRASGGPICCRTATMRSSMRVPCFATSDGPWRVGGRWRHP